MMKGQISILYELLIRGHILGTHFYRFRVNEYLIQKDIKTQLKSLQQKINVQTLNDYLIDKDHQITAIKLKMRYSQKAFKNKTFSTKKYSYYNQLIILIDYIYDNIQIFGMFKKNNQQNDDKEHQSIITYVKNNQDAEAQNQLKDNNRTVQNTTLIPQEPITQSLQQEKKNDDPVGIRTDAEQMKYEAGLAEIKQQDQNQQNKIDIQTNSHRQQQESSKLINQEDKMEVQKLNSIDQIIIENQKIYQQQQMYYVIEGVQPQYFSQQMSLPRQSVSRLCQFCQNPLILRKDHKINGNTICCGVIIALCLSPICCWIPCVLNQCKDKVEVCSSCGETIRMIKDQQINSIQSLGAYENQNIERLRVNIQNFYDLPFQITWYVDQYSIFLDEQNGMLNLTIQRNKVQVFLNLINYYFQRMAHKFFQLQNRTLDVF
ncbi:hypothetical protein pb186bvf_016409 [Paramecium bursaria]